MAGNYTGKQFKKEKQSHYTNLIHAITGGSEGDPHFISFDGFSYSFNGLGTFVLIRAPVFELQGLFGRPTDGGGIPLDATVFKSVVGQQLVPASDVIEMKVDSGGTGVGEYPFAKVQWLTLFSSPEPKAHLVSL